MDRSQQFYFKQTHCLQSLNITLFVLPLHVQADLFVRHEEGVFLAKSSKISHR